ncbi:hypothetical protein B0H14DRAFT_3784052 [Mycena olivaceomarginata]|nr:hypothetical protein B0H14DRAFT_3784052 [Mycena olivaceomarginata]
MVRACGGGRGEGMRRRFDAITALPIVPPTACATQRTPRVSKIQQCMRAGSGSTVHQGQGGGWGDSSDDEFGRGFEEDGEDRMVTARSRRNLVYTLNSSPPPPVPLPGGVTPASSIGGGAGMGIGINIPDVGGSGLQPFLCSPTVSVFSAPDSASIAYTHTSTESTTALNRPTHPQHKALVKGLAGAAAEPADSSGEAAIEEEESAVREWRRRGWGGDA